MLSGILECRYLTSRALGGGSHVQLILHSACDLAAGSQLSARDTAANEAAASRSSSKEAAAAV